SDLRQRHMEALRLLAIDSYEELGIIGGETGEKAGEFVAFGIAFGHHAASDLSEGLERISALVLQYELEAAELTQALNRGGSEGHDQSSGDAEQRSAHAIDDSVGRVSIAGATGDVFERCEDDGAIRRGTAKAEAAYCKGPEHFGLSTEYFCCLSRKVCGV